MHWLRRVAVLTVYLLASLGGVAWSEQLCGAVEFAGNSIVRIGCYFFFDPSLSAEKRLSCASCHDPEKAWQDGYQRALSKGALLPRNTPSLLNLGQYKAFPWDGRFNDAADQISIALFSKAEMESSRELIASAVSAAGNVDEALPGLREKGLNDIEIVVLALTEFVKLIGSPPTNVDDVLKKLSPAAKKGFEVFNSSGCAQCHPPPSFTDGQYHDIGLARVPVIVQTDRTKPLHLSFSLGYDYGRGNVESGTGTLFAFRTPTLWNVAATAPYMHDGRLPNLESVLDFFARGGDLGANRKWQKWTDEDRANLIAFLSSLVTANPARQLGRSQ